MEFLSKEYIENYVKDIPEPHKTDIKKMLEDLSKNQNENKQMLKKIMEKI